MSCMTAPEGSLGSEGAAEAFKPLPLLRLNRYDHKQRTLKHSHKMDHRSQTTAFEPVLVKLFPKRSAKMIDGSKKRKRQLASELQSTRVFEKRGKSIDRFASTLPFRCVFDCPHQNVRKR